MNASTKTDFSFSRVWDDTLKMLGANAGLLTAIAGVFLFLPAVLVAHFVPPPEGGTTPAEMIELMVAWWQGNAHWMLLSAVVNMVGLIAIYLLLLAEPRMTVGGAVAAALPILPFYLLLTVVLNLTLAIGFLLFVIPFIYLLGRLSLASPVLVAEKRRAPFAALERSWALSRGLGWQIALLVLLVYIAALIINVAVSSALGIVIVLLLGNEGVGGLLLAIVGAILSAATTLVATVLLAAIYRALTTSRPDLAKRFS
ncbi:hypothetical protein [Sphingosinicella sp. YJ22]|uniref:hypothetical protein n=1 Tax=Sphingosinicella sp. YJ22 TaxID=1104780 RepID=UPI001407C4FC|nr:hypothetical protein [Sphingosinicella sp. YJ22]